MIPQPKAPITVIVPTRNEEKNIQKCLESLSWVDELFVVDSHSTDRTVEIARGMGAQVVQFSWNGRLPRKYNWALDNLPISKEWVLFVAADEEVPAALRDEIIDKVSGQSKYAGFSIRFRYYFLGRELKHGEQLWKLQLFKHRLTRFELVDTPEVTSCDMEIHEQPLVRGPVGRLKATMVHRDLDNLHHYFERHNTYSDWEALRRVRNCTNGAGEEVRPRPFGSPAERRRFYKHAFFNLPGKPLFYCLWYYVLHGGFLDGRAGFIFTVLRAFYWYQIGVKQYELRLRQRAMPRIVR